MFRYLIAFSIISCSLCLAEDSPTPPSLDEITSLKEQATIIRKRIENGPPQFSLVGTVERGEEADYSVNKEDFVVDSTTRINGDFRIGAQAQVRGERIGNRNYAKKIIVDDDGSVRSKEPIHNDRDSDAPFLGDGPAGLPGQAPIKN